jgi:hypothetical protein
LSDSYRQLSRCLTFLFIQWFYFKSLFDPKFGSFCECLSKVLKSQIFGSFRVIGRQLNHIWDNVGSNGISSFLSVPSGCQSHWRLQSGRPDMSWMWFSGDRVVDVGSEWQTFSNEKSNADPSRVGAAENPFSAVLKIYRNCDQLFTQLIYFSF